MDRNSIYRCQMQKLFVAWLLTADVPPTAVQKFKFNSWAQSIPFQTVMAECFGYDKIEGRPHNAKSRKKCRSIIIRYLKYSHLKECLSPIPIVKRPEGKLGVSIAEQQVAFTAGLMIERSRIRYLPQLYLDQARRLLLLSQELRPSQRECLRLSVSNKHCSLLPDRPRWMQAPSHSVWPGTCRIRAGAEPTGFDGRLWSKKDFLRSRRKACRVGDLSKTLLERKFKRRVGRGLQKRGAIKKGSNC